MLATVLLLGLLLVAAATDLSRRKIYNWTTYPGILAALGLNVVGAVLLATTTVQQESLERYVGYAGVVESLCGLALCGFLMLVCYVLLKLGGGDVKLMAMIGAFLGLYEGVEAMLWTFVLGMCVALIVLTWRVGLWTLGARALRHVFWTLRLGRLYWASRGCRPGLLDDDERQSLHPPLHLAPCALVAVVMVRLLPRGLF